MKNYKELKQINVRDLISQLQKFPQDLLVVLEGCDCETDAYRAIVLDRPWKKEK